MKHLLLTTIAVVLLVGCGGEPPQAETPPAKPEARREEAPTPVAPAEPPLAKPVEQPTRTSALGQAIRQLVSFRR